MINIMDQTNKPMNEGEKCLDPQLWHACAGGMVQMPPLNTKVFYFPQGHFEHSASKNVDFQDSPRIPPYILCQVSAIKFLADSDTDEVYAKITLIPSRNLDLDDDGSLGFDRNNNRNRENSTSFAKTLTQSDANNGGGFSVPRYCAETIFPRLDYSADPPVQTILAKDVHGQIWKFRHIYRGTPRRHLLTTGWSNFVNQKRLAAGDSIVFLRADDGELCVGVRRAKRGTTSIGSSPYEDYKVEMDGKVGGECVVEAVNLAAEGKVFEVCYYPRASTPEFCVKASTVTAAMGIGWRPGMRFKMAFETEDSSRISWFMGTVSSVHVQDQIRWPNSPWRLLQVAWDEPDLLQDVKRVSPWLVELVSNMPVVPLKKLRPPQTPDFSLLSQLIPPSIQGARQQNPFGFSNTRFADTRRENDHNVSCRLTVGTTRGLKNDKKRPAFVLFGQPVFTEQQLSGSGSGGDVGANLSDGSVVLQNGSVENSSDSGSDNVLSNCSVS